MRIDEKYFVGGWDPDHPNGNVETRLYHHDDGTGLLVTYNPDGSVQSEVTVELEVSPPDPEPTATQLVEQILQALTPEQLQGILDSIVGQSDG